jgi:hypothetical protein
MDAELLGLKSARRRNQRVQIGKGALPSSLARQAASDFRGRSVFAEAQLILDFIKFT